MAGRVLSAAGTAALALGGGALVPRGPAGAASRASLARGVLGDLCDGHGLRIRVQGRLPTGAVVLVSNHVSYLDPIVLGGLVPCATIAKAELAGWPIVGPICRTLGTLFVRRGDAHSGATVLRQARRLLGAGVSVLGFPEGTTTTGDRVLPFRRGLFGLAATMGVPVIPVRVDYDDRSLAWTGDATFGPHYLQTAGLPSVGVSVRFGTPLRPSRTDDPDALARLAHFVVSHELSSA